MGLNRKVHNRDRDHIPRSFCYPSLFSSNHHLIISPDSSSHPDLLLLLFSIHLTHSSDWSAHYSLSVFFSLPSFSTPYNNMTATHLDPNKKCLISFCSLFLPIVSHLDGVRISFTFSCSIYSLVLAILCLLQLMLQLQHALRRCCLSSSRFGNEAAAENQEFIQLKTNDC